MKEETLRNFMIYCRKKFSGSEFTHTSLNPRKSYYIPGNKLDLFFKLYSFTISDTDLCLTEKHREISHVLIDFDFRQNDIIRKYTKNHIINISRVYMETIEGYIEVEEDTEIFILEKPPRKVKNQYKDGIHIIIPTIVTKPEYQYEIRRVTMPQIRDILDDCKFINKIEDIYDESVIERNNWFLYGSKKPDEPIPWKVSYILKWKEHQLIESSNTYTDEELVVKFSLRNKYDENDIIINIPRSIKNKSTSVSSIIDKSTISTFTDESYVISLVKLLKSDRAHNYTDWISVGWCLHNISPTLLDLWILFSKSSYKYKDNECECLWNNMKNTGLTMGSLCYWAHKDNPDEYKKLTMKSIFKDTIKCNGTHHSIAKITFKIIKNKFICVSSDSRCWYYFNNNIWKEDVSQIKLRMELSTTIRDNFIYVMNTVITNKVNEEYESSTSNSNKNDKKDAEHLLKIAYKLEDAVYKDNIIKELSLFMYNEEFLDKLDSDPNLLGFNNGVWCLKEGIFRKTVPDDMISFSVGYDYIDNINEDYRQLVIKYFEKMHPDSDQRKYLIKTLARQLYGDNGCELFHIHSGFNASAGNGKSRYFELLELCFGNYIHKFPIEILIAKQRSEAHKPIPEFKNWKGVRIMYTTESTQDDKLNSGILKELTGGEEISYRMLYSNQIQKFRPMFKISMMCNDAPLIEGGDEGIKRRIRKIDYISKFVNKDEVDETNHYYEKDPNFIELFKKNLELRMEFTRYILENYNHDYKFEMPDIIKKSSNIYLEDNNQVLSFVNEFIKKDSEGFFTLKDVKEKFKQSQHFNGKLITLKNELQKILKTQCIDRVRIKGTLKSYVFSGFTLKCDINSDDELEI